MTTDKKTDMTPEEKKQAAKEAWTEEFRQHNRALIDLQCPKQRWSYICNDVKDLRMCDALMRHCNNIVLEVERYKFDNADGERRGIPRPLDHLVGCSGSDAET